MVNLSEEWERCRRQNRELDLWFVAAILLAWAVLATFLGIDARDEAEQLKAAAAPQCPERPPCPVVSTSRSFPEQWCEIANEFCTYLEEDIRDPEGSVWDLLCIGINGRDRSDFDKFFSPGLEDGSCPDDYVCDCKW
jgi:hypothetical protein